MSFYNFVRNESEGVDDLYIDGEIVTDVDWWGPIGQVVARRFRQRLAQCRDVTVYINSPGGDVFAGAELYTALREHKGKVTVKVTGIAASAASVIAMAGDEVLMSPVAYMMIHDPWTYAMGNAREMEHQAEVLREIGEGLVAAYTSKTGKSRGEITSLLAAETYMNAQRCIDEGFADGILYEMPAAPEEGKPLPSAMMQASRYSPSAVLAMVQAHQSGAPERSCFHTHQIVTPPAHNHSMGFSHNHNPRPDPNAVARAEIAQRAKLLAEMYTDQHK